MILQNSKSDVTCIGNIQKNRVSIDANNIDHIITILSSNLYSKPIESFLREIVSNAVDAHTEAKVNEPVIITITDKILSIRDYGTGISPERFETIYLNIGSSTKRQSNEYIGSFGIGRFSALAVSDIVNITSYYEGKAYYYLMSKSNNVLNIDLLQTKDTTEHNGVEVRIPLKSYTQFNDFVEAFMSLYFFPNIYINCSLPSYVDKTDYAHDDIAKFNKRKIHDYKNFKMFDNTYGYYSRRDKILIGNVLYNLDRTQFRDKYQGVFGDALHQIVPKFNIGDLDVTPNREEVLYSERSINKIKEVFDNCLQEIEDIFYEQNKSDFTSILDYLGDTFIKGSPSISIGDTEISIYRADRNSTYKGENIKEFIEKYMHSLTTEKSGVIAMWDGNVISRGQNVKQNIIYQLYRTNRYYKLNDIVILPSAAGFSSKYLKGYLEETYGDSHVLFVENFTFKQAWRALLYEGQYGCPLVSVKNPKIIRLAKSIIVDLLRDFRSRFTFKDILHSDDYIQYKKAHADKKVSIKDSSFVAHIITPGEYQGFSYQRTFKNAKELIDYYYSNYPDCIWVYAPYNDSRIEYLNGLYEKTGIKILALAVANYKLTEYLPKRFKNIDEFFSFDNKHLCRIATLKKLHRSIYNTTGSRIYEIVNKVNAYKDYLPSAAKAMLCIPSKYTDPVDYRNEILENCPKEKYDLEMIATFKNLVKWYNIIKRLEETGITRYFYGAALAYVAMKNKYFRMSYDSYKEIKSLKLKLC